MPSALRGHWPEYLMEAAGLGLFMLSACAFTALLYYPGSLIGRSLESQIIRRVLMGLAMALTAVAIIYSPWGRRSGAHLNPAVTLTFWRVGKVAGWDAAFYIVAQFVGGLAGVLAARVWLGAPVADPAVHYAVTTPGPAGPVVAFGAEIAISFLLMLVVLSVSNSRATALTGLCAGALVAVCITLEAPLSGMSMNPARTVASAVPARTGTALWVYFTAPLIGMLLAADAYLWLARGREALCAKLYHHPGTHCIFCCGYAGRAPLGEPAASRGVRSTSLVAGLGLLALFVVVAPAVLALQPVVAAAASSARVGTVAAIGLGDPRWRRAGDRIFLGIDHTAIVVTDTERSLRFYRDLLGLRVAGESENWGPEQERLNNVFGARLRITTLRAASGPGVELLEYLTPRTGRPAPVDTAANDLVHWHTTVVAPDPTASAARLRGERADFVSAEVVRLPDRVLGFAAGFLARDPDGHALRVTGQEGGR
jgi:aquaporin Z